jgi:hypothetical protein
MLRCSKRWAAGLAAMTNLGRRLERLETRLLPQEDKIMHHIIRFVEGNGTVTGSMVINFDNSQRAPRGWPPHRAPK